MLVSRKQLHIAGARRQCRVSAQTVIVSAAWIVAGAAACRSPAPQGSVPAAPTPVAAAVAPRMPPAPASATLGSGRTATFAPHAMIASNSELASAAGVEVLRQGGNAVDAAVAVGFALAVTLPEAGNLGGGGFMVIKMADGRTAAFDYREVAPLAATRDMYLRSDGSASRESIDGPKASGVPGAVAGLSAASRAFGRLPLRSVIAPALRLARDGFIVDSAFARSIAGARTRIAPYAGAPLFLPGGAPPPVGSRFVQPTLARTLEQIATQGADAFYRGPIATAVADEMRRDGGLITTADLERYQAARRTPLEGTYRGYTLLAMPPASSGGVTVIETLNILETFDRLPPFGSAGYAHVLGDAFQRAFIDRNGKLGDPAFVDVPVDRLTSKAYARQVRATIAPDRATPTSRLVQQLAEGTQTTHYSVVDADGSAVATTTTLNDLYGSGVFVRDAGFFLNDEMDDFATRPGLPNMFGLVEGPQNAIAPGKRMLSSMSPTIVLDSAGKVFLVVGARGGPRIITSTTQVIVNAIDYRMGLMEALAAPRLHDQARPDSLRYDRNGFTQPVLDSLTAMGYTVVAGGASATCTAVMRTPSGWAGAVDPRSTGGAVGY
jgi:gamma-glutamyltranspeptidase / glutathione hydrolase